MSASPQPGQGTVVMLLPRDQKAGQRPWFVVSGSWILPSIRPYLKFTNPWVFRRAEYQLVPTVNALTRRCPLPSMYALELLGEKGVGHPDGLFANPGGPQ